MKISQLIKLLDMAKREYGDVSVDLWSDEEGNETYLKFHVCADKNGVSIVPEHR